MHYRIKEVIRQ